MPVGVQIHKNEKNKEFYLVNAHLLVPCEEHVFHKSAGDLPVEVLEHLAVLESQGKPMRPELSLNYHQGKVQKGMVFHKWQNPVMCNECDETIEEYEFYFFEKRSVAQSKHII